jgi:hypothetical protein
MTARARGNSLLSAGRNRNRIRRAGNASLVWGTHSGAPTGGRESLRKLACAGPALSRNPRTAAELDVRITILADGRQIETVALGNEIGFRKAEIRPALHSFHSGIRSAEAVLFLLRLHAFSKGDLGKILAHYVPPCRAQAQPAEKWREIAGDRDPPISQKVRTLSPCAASRARLARPVVCGMALSLTRSSPHAATPSCALKTSAQPQDAPATLSLTAVNSSYAGWSFLTNSPAQRVHRSRLGQRSNLYWS